MTFVINGRTPEGESIKAAFVHVPRTAGRWAVGACKAAGLSVSQCGYQHEPYQKAIAHIPAGAEVFTICRHPATWLLSWYTSTAVNGWKGWTNPTNELMEYQSPTFAEFVEKLRPGHVTDIWRRYLGEGITVLAHESIAVSLVAFLNYLDFDFDRGAIAEYDATQFRSDHKDTITPELYRTIREKASALYVKFGYPTQE